MKLPSNNFEQWSSVEKTSKDKISDAKIRVVYKTVGTSATEPTSPATPVPVAAGTAGAAAFTTPSTANGRADDAQSTTAVVDEKIANLESELKKAAAPAEKSVPEPTGAAASTSASSTGAVTGTRTGGQGVPIPVALLLCLIAFLLAWLFF